MEKQIQTNLLGRKVHRDICGTFEEGIVVAVWTETVIEGRNYPYNDGYRVTRVFFLLESKDGSLSECKAKDAKTHLPSPEM